MPTEIHHIDISGFRCRYAHIERPSLPTVVLLAGAMQQIETIDSYLSLFKNYNIYVIELPGQGASDTLEDGYSFAFLGSCLHKFIDRFVDSNYFLFSYSYSNIITIEFLKAGMNLPDKSILAGSMASMTENQRLFIQGLVHLSPKDCVEAFIDFITSNTLNSRQQQLLKRASVRFSLRYMKKYPTHFYNNTNRLLAQEVGDLSTITTKCLAIAGESDPFVTPEQCKELANKINGCEFATIKESDHLFCLQQPDLTRKLIESFFSA